MPPLEKEGKDLCTYIEKNTSPKEVLMVEMVDVEAILFYVVIKTCGHYST
jgi:hypothetical protein